MTDQPSSADFAPQPELAEPDEAAGPATALAILTEFTPVPRRFNRGDVWTEQVQRAFIDALADTGSVEGACRMVGRSPASAYRLRRHPLGGEFGAAWQVAVDLGIHRIEDYAMDRAANGVEVPIFNDGERIGTRRVVNDQLAMFMLRNRLSDRYCAGGPRAMNAVDKRMLARQEKQLRAQWERELAERLEKEDEEVYAEIDAFLDTMVDNRKGHMSPAQRERQIAADAQARADKAAGWSSGMPYREYAAQAARLLPRFVAEVEAEWPPLGPWAWDGPEEDAAEADETPALPPPPEEAKEEPEACPERSRGAPSGPRIRSTKDEGW